MFCDRRFLAGVALGGISLLSVSCTGNGSDPFAFLINGRQETYLPIYSLPGKASRGGEIEASLANLITLSRTSVYCSFFDVNSPSVVNALMLKKAGGLDVRVGLSSRAQNGVGYERLSSVLTTSGRSRELWISDSSGENHLNVCVGDRTRVWLSTVPPMRERLESEAAYSAYFQSDEDGLARKFNVEMDLVTHGSFGPNKQRLDRRNYWLISDASIGAYFNPAEKTLSNFMIPRIADATSSIQVFGSEFFSNSRDGSGFRKEGDLAFELLKSGVPPPDIVGTFYGFRAEDIAASDETPGDFEAYWNIDTSHTDPNSLFYLFRKGKNVRILPHGTINGMNFVLIDAATRRPQLYVASHPFSGDAESKTDGLFLDLEYGPYVVDFANFFAALDAMAVSPPSGSGDAASAREVVISEILWMGGRKRTGDASSYEYVELYNNSDRTINLTDWKIECGENGAFADAYVLSSANEANRLIIGPGQYIVITDDTAASGDDNSYVRIVHTKVDNAGSDAIADLSDQCRLVDSSANVIDTAGESGKPFILYPDQAGKVDGDSGAVRSMERTDTSADGANLSNWHTNSHSDSLENGNILVSFAGHDTRSPGTFGTPGFRNSSVSAVPSYRNPARDLKINEFYYNASTDYWVEIYNSGSSTIDLAAQRVYFIRDSDCDLTNGVTTATALTGQIAPGSFFLLSRDSAVLAGSADQTTAAALNGDDCIALIFGSAIADAADNRTIDFLGFDNSGSKENGSTIALPSGSAVSRCSDGTDTDVNASDFSAQTATPKASNQ
ncbi:MAG: lamin tail domain-containing protein, partial [Leptospiraceae bacterium]|nr:lamin tail domain-containing protein [Leptospiraceae bacterium]